MATARQLPRLFQSPSSEASAPEGDPQLANQMGDLASSIQENTDTLAGIDGNIERLVSLQEQDVQERARKALADEEAAMEARNQFAPLLEINQSLKDIKKTLSDTQRQTGRDGAGGGGKGIADSLLGGLAGLIGGKLLGGKGAAGKAGGGAGGGWGLGRILKATAGASLGSLGGGALGEMLGGETGKAIGEVAGGALGAIGLSGISRKRTPTVPTPAAPVPVSRPPVTPGLPAGGAPTAAPTVTPPRPGTMTEAQKAQYDQYRKQGMPAAEAKDKATKSGFERLVSREQTIQAAARPTPVPTVSPTPTAIAAPATPVPAAPGAPSVATPTAPTPGAPGAPTPPGKTSMLGKIASMGGKAARFIPGVGQALAVGAAAYETGKAAMDAENVLGIQGRKATWGERAAAGAGGLAESLSFGILGKEKTAGLLKAATGAGKEADMQRQASSAGSTSPAASPTSTPSTTAAAAPAPSSTGAALTPPTTAVKASATKPKMAISGEQDIKNMIIKHEGIRYEPYKDSLGLWTVGVGHLIGDGKTLPPQWNRKFSHEEVMAMFEEDYAHHKHAAEKIPNFSKMNKFGQGALTDLTFNMGPAWINKWPTLRKQLGAGDVEGAASNLEGSKWYQQVKSRGPTIVSMIRAGADGPTSAAQQTSAPAATSAREQGETAAAKPAAAAPSQSGAATGTSKTQTAASQPNAVPAETGGQVKTESGGTLVTESGSPVTTAPAAPAAAPQGNVAPRGGQIGRMSEQTARPAPAAAAPVIINNNSSPTTVASSGNGGRGMPSPYADRGSLSTSTTFIAGA